MTRNEHGQPIGAPLLGWTPPLKPDGRTLDGNHVTLEPLTLADHARGLWRAFSDVPASLWTYMTYGPFASQAELEAALLPICESPDWVPYTYVVDGEPLGFAAYLRIQPADGVVEIGAITLSPQLQRTTAATEAIFLFLDHVFALGYRRCEWKCDDLNEPSRAAAVRFGFEYEGTFAQATHYKGRNRDTAWYAITDARWRELADVYRNWLAPTNFDEDGTQRKRLEEMRT